MTNRHRATTRYKNGGKHRGKTISQKEQARRIAQSYGYDIRNTLFQPKPTPDTNNSGDTIIVA